MVIDLIILKTQNKKYRLAVCQTVFYDKNHYTATLV